MQLRRSSALAAGLLVLCLPALTSCGFDAATQEYYTPGPGANDRDGDVDVLGAVVVSAQDGSGTFIATLVNSTPEPVTFDGLEGAEGAPITVEGFESVEVAGRGMVNLAEEGGTVVTGDFVLGDFLGLTLTFADAESVVLDVPVVAACYEFEGLDESAEGPPDYSCDPGEPTDGPTAVETVEDPE